MKQNSVSMYFCIYYDCTNKTRCFQKKFCHFGDSSWLARVVQQSRDQYVFGQRLLHRPSGQKFGRNSQNMNVVTTTTRIGYWLAVCDQFYSSSFLLDRLWFPSIPYIMFPQSNGHQKHLKAFHKWYLYWSDYLLHP